MLSIWARLSGPALIGQAKSKPFISLANARRFTFRGTHREFSGSCCKTKSRCAPMPSQFLITLGDWGSGVQIPPLRPIK